MSPPAERAQAPRRWAGIRVQLLLLLLPGMALLLGIDSWVDHEYRSAAIDTSYDESLLRVLSAINRSVRMDEKGDVDMAVPDAVQSMFLSGPSLYRELHMGLAQLDNAGAALAERTLLGTHALPAPPADAAPIPPRAGFEATRNSRIVFYPASDLGHAVRVASLQRDVLDASGKRYRLHLQAAESTEWRVEAREHSARREVEHDLRMLVAAALMTWFGVAWALRPLKRLRASLSARPAHEMQPLDSIDVPNEVAPLVDAVNHNIEVRQKALSEQRRFLTDAAHQLRTPIAIMMTQIAYAMREKEPQPLQESLQAINAQLGRSQRLTDQLLAMADASRASDEVDPAPLVDLNDLAHEVVLQYVPLARAKNQDLGWDDIRGEQFPANASDGVAAAPVRARPAELHEALANLLDNAINHTPVNGSITVAVRIEDQWVMAEVTDTGPGIPPERREASFERFRRGAPKAGTTRGAGLGLAIARAYARRNGGDIVLVDPAQQRAGVGLCARLLLPLASAVEE